MAGVMGVQSEPREMAGSYDGRQTPTLSSNKTTPSAVVRNHIRPQRKLEYSTSKAIVQHSGKKLTDFLARIYMKLGNTRVYKTRSWSEQPVSLA